jgi:AraC-like DNA-binding protein
VDDKKYDVTSGSVLIISPGQYHKPISVSKGFEKLSISFSLSNGGLGDSMQAKLKDSFIFSGATYASAKASEFLKEFFSSSPFKEEMLASILSELIVSVLRIMQVSEKKVKAPASTDKTADIIDNFFEKRVTEYGNEEDLAKALHLSKRQLCRVLQARYGMSFREKLLRAKMDYAGWLLRTTSLKVTQICNSIGYSSEAVFYKNFKDYYGVTPKKYREERRS